MFSIICYFHRISLLSAIAKNISLEQLYLHSMLTLIFDPLRKVFHILSELPIIGYKCLYLSYCTTTAETKQESKTNYTEVIAVLSLFS